jgi:hypothetical protein
MPPRATNADTPPDVKLGREPGFHRLRPRPSPQGARIANMLGVRREGSSRPQGKLQKLGVIEYSRGQDLGAGPAAAGAAMFQSHRASAFRQAALANTQPRRAALACWNHGPVGPHHDMPPLGRFDVCRTFPDAVVTGMRGAEPSELGVRLRARLVQDGSYAVLSPAERARALHDVEHLCRSRK